MRRRILWAVSLLTAVLAVSAGAMPALADENQPTETKAAITTTISEETTTTAAETTVTETTSLRSDDLPSGNCRIQVIAADAAGRVSVMEQYGAARQGLPDSINSLC